MTSLAKRIVFLLSFFVASVVVGCAPPRPTDDVPTVAADETFATATAPKPKAADDAIVPRWDAGPRAEAPKGYQDIAGVRVRVTHVRIGPDFNNGMLIEYTDEHLLKVQVQYEGLALGAATKFRYDEATADASSVYDHRNNRCVGITWQGARSIEMSSGQRASESIYFVAPYPGTKELYLDYAPSFVPKGQKYRFRIPATMVQSKQ